MTKYLLGFALSYAAALLAFAVLGTVSLFRWPVGPVPTGYGVLWTLVPLGTACLLGRLLARRWAETVGAASASGTLILLAVVAVLTLLAWRLEALQPFSAPGRLFSMTLRRLLFRQEGELLPLTLCGALLYPAAYYLGWRLGA